MEGAGMSSLASTIYDHMPFINGTSRDVSSCSCGTTFIGEPGARMRWAEHLAKIIDAEFINVTHIPAKPAAEPQPAEVAKFNISVRNDGGRPTYIITIGPG